MMTTSQVHISKNFYLGEKTFFYNMKSPVLLYWYYFRKVFV